MEKQINANLDSKNLASYGKFLDDNKKIVPLNGIKQCEEGVEQMSSVADAFNEKKGELKALKSDMYVGITLKLGRSMQEKDEYIQSTINELWVMED